MAGFVVLLHVVGWGVLVGIVAPAALPGRPEPGLRRRASALTAYTLGMRHAFDADHIAAIDNTTRKLMAEGKRPLSVGFWFSLGHSSIVFGLVPAALVRRPEPGRPGGERLVHAAADDRPDRHRASPACSSTSSGSSTWSSWSGSSRSSGGCAHGAYDEAALEDQLNNRGFMNRILGGATKAVRKPWHMYPVGLLFGLGFDTATEVGLLVLAGGAAAFALPWYAILTLPILFAAGMSLLDTHRRLLHELRLRLGLLQAGAQGLLQHHDHRAVGRGRADHRHHRAGVDRSPRSSASRPGRSPRSAASTSTTSGYAIVGLFVLTWVIALAVWRFGRIEEKWSAGLQEGTPATVAGD